MSGSTVSSSMTQHWSTCHHRDLKARHEHPPQVPLPQDLQHCGLLLQHRSKFTMLKLLHRCEPAADENYNLQQGPALRAQQGRLCHSSGAPASQCLAAESLARDLPNFTEILPSPLTTSTGFPMSGSTVSSSRWSTRNTSPESNISTSPMNPSTILRTRAFFL